MCDMPAAYLCSYDPLTLWCCLCRYKMYHEHVFALLPMPGVPAWHM
jgi:hypothetical protein